MNEKELNPGDMIINNEGELALIVNVGKIDQSDEATWAMINDSSVKKYIVFPDINPKRPCSND